MVGRIIPSRNNLVGPTFRFRQAKIKANHAARRNPVPTTTAVKTGPKAVSLTKPVSNVSSAVLPLTLIIANAQNKEPTHAKRNLA